MQKKYPSQCRTNYIERMLTMNFVNVTSPKRKWMFFENSDHKNITKIIVCTKKLVLRSKQIILISLVVHSFIIILTCVLTKNAILFAPPTGDCLNYNSVILYLLFFLFINFWFIRDFSVYCIFYNETYFINWFTNTIRTNFLRI